jgi:TolA-binding protein
MISVTKRWVMLVALTLAASVPAQESDQAQIDFANGLFQRGFYDEAVDEYRSYIKQFPEGKYLADALYRMGEAHAAAKRYGDAVTSLDALLDRFPETSYSQRAHLRKGVSLFQLKKYPDALLELKQVSVPETDESVRGEALYYSGKIYVEQKKNDVAIATFGRLLQETSTSPFAAYAQFQQAYLWVTTGDLEKAATAFAAIQDMPGATRALKAESMYRAAAAYDKLGWYDAAVKAYQNLKREHPDTQYARKADYAYAWVLFKDGKTKEALAACDGYLKQYPESSSVPGIHYLMGNCYQKQEEYDRAIERYRVVRAEAKGTPLAVRAHFKECWALYWNGTPDLARAEAESFLETGKEFPQLGDIHFLLGTIAMEAGRIADAKAYFIQVASSFPDSEFAADALYKSGECARQLDQMEEAARYFEQFAAAHPDHPLGNDATFYAGESRLRLGEFDAAADIFSQLLENGGAKGRETEVLYGLAAARHNQGRYAESVDVFKRLLKEYPDSDFTQEARYRIGDYLLREAKKPVDAVDYFKAIFEADPHGEYAEKAMEGIALSRFEAKDYDGAAQMFHRLVTEYSGATLDADMLAWVGQHLFDREEWEQSADVFDYLVTANPKFPGPERILMKIAEARENAKAYDAAFTAYEAVVTKSPFSALALEAKYRMALLYETKGNADKAVSLLEETASANTGDTAARARFRLGELAEAEKAYEKAARHYLRVAILFLHPELSPEALWRAGQCFEKIKDTSQAKSTYQEIVLDYPESSQAESARSRLRALAAS